MVMRRVFNHHVCLCVLSTAILAGLALMTSQTKVYAGENCKGLASGGEDDGSGLIVCDGTGTGSGVKNGVGELSGKRNIDMSGRHDEAAVTITGPRTNIRISSELKVRDSRGSNNNPAIKVSGQGKLTVDNADVAEVQKGIVVENKGSSVTVVQGKIGVRKAGGGPVIEVKNEGEVVFNRGVTVGTISGSNVGEVVINNGGTVELNKLQLKDVTTGIVVKGGGNANVKGGATITVKQGVSGTGFKMEGVGTADVMDMTITGNVGGGNRTGVVMEGQGGILTLNNVKLMQLETGAKVTNGTLKMIGKSTINVAGSGTGMSVGGSGTVMMMGESTINVAAGGKGLEVTGSEGMVEMTGKTTINFTGDYGVSVGAGVTSATLTGVTIKGSGSGGGGNGVGVYAMSGSLTVSGGSIKGVKAGIKMEGNGVLKVEGVGISFTGDVSYDYGVKVGTSVSKATLTDVKIEGQNKGIGVLIMGGEVTMERVNVSKVETGIYATGGKNLTVIGGAMTQVQTRITMMGGTLTVKDSTKIWFTKDYGIKVGKGVTEASLTKVEIVGNGKGSGVLMMGGEVTMERVNVSKVETGIYAGGGNLTVIGGEMTGVQTGITMMGGKSLTVKDSTKIGFTKDYGIKLGKSVSKAELTKVEIVGSNRGKGVVWESAGTLTLEKVNISMVTTGVEVKKGQLTVEGGSIGFEGAYGVIVGESVKSAELKNVKIRGGKSGQRTGVLMGSSGTLEKVEISRVTTGVEVSKGTVTINEGTIGFTDVGLRVEGEDATTVTVTGTKITGEGNNGMMSKGVYVGKGNVTLEKVDISQVEMGVQVKGSGSLTINEGTTIQFKGSYGVSVGNSVTANLKGATITGEGGGTGVWAKGGTVMMEKVDISNVGMGVYAEGGVLKVSGGTRIEFMAGGTGVYVGKSVTANLKGTVIRGSGNNGVGVYTVGGKVLTMTKVDISNVGTGVYAMGGTLIMKDGEIGFMRAYGVAIEGGAAALMGVTMRYKGDNKVKGADVVSPSFIKVDGRGANLTAIKVMITGNEQGLGVKVANGGHVTLKQSHIPIQPTIHIIHNLIL
ncbi:hypothetical protein [Bartonella schoenbuchensis]|uniref:hypothetical protein n=1 Tax=Bartonella schoenbuchensis TaxID=165694 RepID=UPI0031450086